ncbi:hypothetical protein A2954_06065 [Candidatus Roizmanbacteria bacterium RIFCSPLOWO2_01_FULL_37_12]|uniref:Addiction module toxin, HicA family n=1 Tax=Candidatus Roizmanbacteria bacterium RIFCSPLOWO2_01_FULL_37_12 TaxID=1802056 RepID=A0A1F7ICJ1_9BACT|nr:MAG: hypothetical protein A2768_01225 [Candidatus Roizmanbacteria bacterium RIFCSPHIGHO2_01_FULL_37_16]OGK26038.1 MAG: hypothetical protein A3D76_00290 [Candidatus Roizmanbacteria bacterium RIFCSPHIGHO2_02_FULL_37_9b]OGK41069.1 MAG: hypothetical protein A2954_06065 [Candidatus Roizmanbacteria bacterium RIFCSPLOWO2_01_FULL_37_12]
MKIKQVRPKDLLKALLKLGFIIKRQKGSHIFLERTLEGQKYFTSISLHREPLAKGTLKAILKQTSVSEVILKELL